jgi:hypothetical protein
MEGRRDTRELDRLADAYRKGGRIMIAGPQSMANRLAAELKHRNIPGKNVIKDAFFGYGTEEAETKFRWRSARGATIGRKPSRRVARILPVRRSGRPSEIRANADHVCIRPLSFACSPSAPPVSEKNHPPPTECDKLLKAPRL